MIYNDVINFLIEILILQFVIGLQFLVQEKRIL